MLELGANTNSNSKFALIRAMMLVWMIFGAVAATQQPAEPCAGNQCMSEDDAVGNILLQAQLAIAEVEKKQTAVLLSIEKKAGVFHGLYGALVKDSKNDGNNEPSDLRWPWPQPDDPNNQVTAMDFKQMQDCKQAFSMKNPEVYNTSEPCCMALTRPEFNIEHGVHDILFQILKLYPEDKFQWVRQWAWRGLSDNCFTEVGSQSISNIGGPNQGVEYMVEQLLVNPPYAGMCLDHVDIQYEILADLQGLLLFDNNNTRAPAAMKAGLVPAMVRSLTIEPDFRPTLSFTCRVMTHAMMRNPDYPPLFRDAGVPELLERAVEVLLEPDDTEFHFGVTMSEYYDPSICQYPLLMMKGDALSKLQANAGLQDYLDLVRDWKQWANIVV